MANTCRSFYDVPFIMVAHMWRIVWFALFVPSMASAQVFKFECQAPETTVVHIVELDATAKQARFWARFSPTQTNGPFGPFPATITPQKIIWTDIKTTGRASSTTTYTLDRNKRTLNIHIIYNAFMDQDPWDETSPCKPG